MNTYQKSLRTSLLASLLVTSAIPLTNWYYLDSGLSPIIPQVVRIENGWPWWSLIIAFVFIWVRYVMYDLISRHILTRVQSRFARYWFAAVYCTAILIDIFCIAMATRPIPDSGFAIIGMIIYTIPALTLGNLALFIALLSTRSRQ